MKFRTALRIKNTSRKLLVYSIIVLTVLAVVINIFIYKQITDSTLRRGASASTSTNLNEIPSLDIDVAPDGSYITRVDQFERRRQYHYITDQKDPNFQFPNPANRNDKYALPITPEIQFGKAIAQVGNGFVAGMDPSSTRKIGGSVAQLDLHQGNPRLYRDLLQNARVYNVDKDQGIQYRINPSYTKKMPNDDNVYGFYFVDSLANAANPYIDCINYQENTPNGLLKSERKNFNTSGRLKTLSPGPSLPADARNLPPPNSDAYPIFYRFGRGKVLSMHSANGNVAALVETRIFFDNVCNFASNSSLEADSAIGEQKLTNATIPVVALVVYRQATKTWTTRHLSQNPYRVATIPSLTDPLDNDIFLWGVGVGGLSANATTPGELPDRTKIKPSVTADVSYHRNPYPSFNDGGGGDRGVVRFAGYSNIFSSSPAYHEKELRVMSNCAGTRCGWPATILSKYEPLYKRSDGRLYITVYNPNRESDMGRAENTDESGTSYILGLRSAQDIDNIDKEGNAPNNSQNKRYRKYRYILNRGSLAGECTIDYGGIVLSGYQTHDNPNNAGDCIDEPRQALGYPEPNRVPLLDGTSLKFESIRMNSGNSGFYIPEENLPNGLDLTAEQVKHPSYINSCLYGSVMVGSLFNTSGVDRNIIAIADNAGITGSSCSNRAIWIGGENVGGSPMTLNNFTVACSDKPGEKYNPYKLKVSIETKSPDSPVYTNYLNIGPYDRDPLQLNSSEAIYNVVGHAFVSNIKPGETNHIRIRNLSVPGTYINSDETSVHAFEKTSVYPNNQAGAVPSPLPDSVIYQITETKMQHSADKKNATLSFYLEFNRNKEYYKQFYNSNGFLLALFAQNASGETLTTTKKILFDPIETCSTVYLSTSNGDFRSYETFGGGQDYNKFWQNQRSDYSAYSANDNTPSEDNIPVSSFTFETPNGSCNIKDLQMVGTPFCVNITSDAFSLRRTSMLNSLSDGISALNSSVTLDKLIVTQALSDYGDYQAIFSSNYNELTVRPSLGPSNPNKMLLIDIPQAVNSYNKVIVEESLTDNGVDNMIIRCQTDNCVIEVKPVTTYSRSQVTLNTNASGHKTVKAQDNNAVASFKKKKTRIYINYQKGESRLPQGPATVSGVHGRQVILKDDYSGSLACNAANTNSNYYQAAIFTDGYLYSDKTSSTNLINGTVVARGIVARSGGPEKADLCFKNYASGMPFLNIEYDPKIISKVRNILYLPAGDVNRKFIGL